MRDVIRKLVWCALAGCLLSGCADAAPSTAQPMGSGGSCEQQLAAVVDESYLVDQGVKVMDPGRGRRDRGGDRHGL